MKDTEFKNFNHIIPEGYSIATTGKNLNRGYAPDISISNSLGKVCLIIENERKSERKAFIGAFIKACKYAEDEQSELKLLFVMKETGNQVTVEQISNNIRPYVNWLNSLGATYLTQVIFISDTEYDKSISNNEKILSNNFMSRCTVIIANNAN